MIINAIDRIDPVRIGELRDFHPLYPLYPSESLRALALNRAERISRASPVDFPRIAAARQQPAAIRTPTPVQAPDAQNANNVGDTIDLLRNQYATHRMTSAVQAFVDAQAPQKDRADTVTSLDQPERTLPIPKYLVAFGNPPIEQLQSAVQGSIASARVGPVANVAAARNTTEDALSTDPQTRANVRRLRATDA
jgi:hypothetical protein